MSVEEARNKKKQKMKRRYIFRTIVLAVLIVAIIYALVSNLSKDNEVYKAGDDAPNFELPQVNELVDSDQFQLDDFKGKGVMLNFWATYCEPCEREMPYMESLYPEYKDDIEIIAVSLDVSELVIQQFVNKYDLSFPILHDKKSTVMDLYNVKPIPSTFFIDAEGKIVDKVEGELSLDKLEDYFKKIQPNP